LNEIMVSPRCLDSRSCGKTDRRLPSYADKAAPSINRRSNLNKVVVTGFEEFPAVSCTEKYLLCLRRKPRPFPRVGVQGLWMVDVTRVGLIGVHAADYNSQRLLDRRLSLSK
jgi:hypothetical protein